MRGLRKGSGAGRAAHTPDAWRSNASHYIQTKLMQCLVRVASNTLGFEPRAFRMRSGCDTTTPCAQWRCALGGACCLLIQATLRGQEVSTLARAPPPLPSSPPSPPPPRPPALFLRAQHASHINMARRGDGGESERDRERQGERERDRERERDIYIYIIHANTKTQEREDAHTCMRGRERCRSRVAVVFGKQTLYSV
jgi:hypothetical protein